METKRKFASLFRAPRGATNECLEVCLQTWITKKIQAVVCLNILMIRHQVCSIKWIFLMNLVKMVMFSENEWDLTRIINGKSSNVETWRQMIDRPSIFDTKINITFQRGK
jgi:hypothetical protein